MCLPVPTSGRAAAASSRWSRGQASACPARPPQDRAETLGDAPDENGQDGELSHAPAERFLRLGLGRRSVHSWCNALVQPVSRPISVRLDRSSCRAPAPCTHWPCRPDRRWDRRRRVAGAGRARRGLAGPAVAMPASRSHALASARHCLPQPAFAPLAPEHPVARFRLLAALSQPTSDCARFSRCAIAAFPRRRRPR